MIPYLHIIYLIAQREFLTRVRKKTFIIMTLLGPVLFGAIMVVPIWLATRTTDTQTIQVLDESGYNLTEKLQKNAEAVFVKTDGPFEYIREMFLLSNHDALLYIPKLDLGKPDGLVYYTKSNIDPVQARKIELMLKSEIQNAYLRTQGLNNSFLDNIWNRFKLKTISLTQSTEKNSFADANAAAGMAGAVLIYFFIFLYGTQVLRGVLEEKTNRIIEVLITTVAPFQLMLGKILGIATLALLQFGIWITLTLGISKFVTERYKTERFTDANIEQTLQQINPADVPQALEVNQILNALGSLELPYLIGVFMFYFLFGYLLYAALFAAIGAAADSETDTQQFMLPITLPLLVSFVFAQTILTNPDSNLALYLSMIPLTAPVTMMVRLPFGVPPLQLVLSMMGLVVAFIGCTYIAARIYKTGILMYGKKVTYAELWKWLRFKA